MDYKATLNLPKTDFPMKADLANREPKVLDWWDRIDVYGKIRAARATARAGISRFCAACMRRADQPIRGR